MASKEELLSLEQEMQSLQAYLNEYTRQYDLLSQQFQFMENARLESISSIEALEALGASEGDEISTLLTLGGGVSVRAKVIDPKKVLVGIGAGVTVEKSTEEGIGFLRDRMTEMHVSSKRVSDSLDKLQEQITAIQTRMQEIYSLVQNEA